MLKSWLYIVCQKYLKTKTRQHEDCTVVSYILIISTFKQWSEFDRQDLTRETAFYEGWSWLKFNTWGLTPSKNLRFYISLAKGLKLIPMFGEVTGEKQVGGSFCPPTTPSHPLSHPPFWIGLIAVTLRLS